MTMIDNLSFFFYMNCVCKLLLKYNPVEKKFIFETGLKLKGIQQIIRFLFVEVVDFYVSPDLIVLLQIPLCKYRKRYEKF